MLVTVLDLHPLHVGFILGLLISDHATNIKLGDKVKFLVVHDQIANSFSIFIEIYHHPCN